MHRDRGKEILNRPFQDMLKRESIQFHVYRNPDVKCAIVKRAHRTLRNKLYTYLTYKNTYMFIDLLPRYVKGYNAVHSVTGIASAAVIDRHVLEIWTRMNNKRNRICIGRVKFREGRHVRISKEKMKLAKGSEHNYTDEIFKISKVIRRTPRCLRIGGSEWNVYRRSILRRNLHQFA